jgi:hypothetical protein
MTQMLLIAGVQAVQELHCSPPWQGGSKPKTWQKYLWRSVCVPSPWFGEGRGCECDNPPLCAQGKSRLKPVLRRCDVSVVPTCRPQRSQHALVKDRTKANVWIKSTLGLYMALSCSTPSRIPSPPSLRAPFGTPPGYAPASVPVRKRRAASCM